MHNRRYLLILGVMAAVIVLAVGLMRRWTPPAAPRNVMVTQDYELTATVEDALVVAADTVRLDSDSRVRGDAALIGRSSVYVDGRIDGSLTVMSDRLDIGPHAQINGDVAFLGNQITVAGTITGDLSAVARTITAAPSTAITGTVTACAETLETTALRADQLLPCRDHDTLNALTALQNLNVAGLLLPLVPGLAALAALAVAAFPRRFSRLALLLRSTPRSLARPGCLGLLAVIGLAAGLVLLLALVPPIGLVLLPFGLLLALGLLVLAGIGWTTLALLAGNWLARGTALPPVVAVIPGSLLLGLGLAGAALTPVGLILVLVTLAALIALGLGATLAARRSRRPAYI